VVSRDDGEVLPICGGDGDVRSSLATFGTPGARGMCGWMTRAILLVGLRLGRSLTDSLARLLTLSLLSLEGAPARPPPNCARSRPGR